MQNRAKGGLGEGVVRRACKKVADYASPIRPAGAVSIGMLSISLWISQFKACEQNVNKIYKVMAYDVRSIANFVIDLAESKGRDVSNLSINKIVFFLHAYFLVQFERPLVSAKVEAWNYGPVFRELYKEFKAFGDKPIQGRACRISADSGKREICEYDFTPDERAFLENLALKFIPLSSGVLVSMSHEEDGPWDQVWNHATPTNASMSISNDLIRDWYKNAARH